MAYKFQLGAAKLGGNLTTLDITTDSDGVISGSIGRFTHLSCSANSISIGATVLNETELAVLDGFADVNFDTTADSIVYFDATSSKFRRDDMAGFLGQIDGDGLSVSGGNKLKIGSGAIVRAMLEDDAVDGTKLADDAVDSEHIAADSIDSEHYAAGSVDATALASNSVETAKVADDAVTYAKIQNVSATARILGRNTSGAGAIEEVTPAQLMGMFNSDLGGNFAIGNQSSDSATFAGAVVVGGDLTVNGTTTTVNSTSVQIDDLNLQLADGAAAASAVNGGGITLANSGDDFTFAYNHASTAWKSSIDMDLASSKLLKIAGTEVLSAAGSVKVQSAVAGNGLAHSSGVLSVGVDGTGIEINSDALRLKDAGVVTAKIADANVTTAKIADVNVTTGKLADDAVTAAKLAADAVVDASVAANAAIAHSKLASVASARILMGNGSNVATATAISGDVSLTALGSLTINANAISNAKMADDSVGAAELIDNSVGAAAMADDAIETAFIAADAVTNAKLADDAVQKENLAADVAGTGLEQHSDDSIRIAAAAAGDGLQGGGGSALSVLTRNQNGLDIDGSGRLRVRTDAGSGLELDADGVGIKASGVVAAMIADDAVTTAKILNANVTTTKIADANVTNAKLANSALTIGSTSVALGASSTVFAGITQLTASAIRVTDLDVVNINSISQTEQTLEIVDKLLVSALSASSADSDGGGLQIGGGASSAGQAAVKWSHGGSALKFSIGANDEFMVKAGAFLPEGNNVKALGSDGNRFSNLHTTAISLAGTAISSTAAELNKLDGASADVTAAKLSTLAALTNAEIAFVDGAQAGSAAASKAMVLDSDADISGARNFTISGELDAATGDFSSNVDVGGVLSIAGANITATPAELNLLDAGVTTAVEVLADTDNFIMFDDSAGDAAKKVKMSNIREYVQKKLIGALNVNGAANNADLSLTLGDLGSVSKCNLFGADKNVNAILPAIDANQIGEVIMFKGAGDCSAVRTLTIKPAAGDKIDGTTNQTILLESPNAAITLVVVAADEYAIF